MALIGLADMPNEILSKIVDYTPRSSLLKLALVSRRFTNLVLPRLYKSIFYNPGHQGKDEIPHLRTRIYSLDCLVTSLEENEQLRSLILEARLIWGRLLIEMDANISAITRLLSILDNLQTLQLLPGHVYFTHARPAQVSSLHICMTQGKMVDVELLEALLANKFLRNLRMTTIQSWTSQTEDPDETAKPSTIKSKSFISHLTISSAACSAATMQTLLHAPQELVSLHYHYHGRQFQTRNAISPSNFPAPLLTQLSSLEEVIVYAQPHQHISLQHPVGHVMKSMRGFIALRRLGLPAWWMVHPGLEHREGQIAGNLCLAKLVEMLPPKLEILQIQLEEIRLHCRNQIPFEHLSRTENVLERYGMLLLWLREIAVWKQEYTPLLKEVVVWSSGPKLPHETRMCQESGIEGAFMEQGVAITFITCHSSSPMLFGIDLGN